MKFEKRAHTEHGLRGRDQVRVDDILPSNGVDPSQILVPQRKQLIEGLDTVVPRVIVSARVAEADLRTHGPLEHLDRQPDITREHEGIDVGAADVAELPGELGIIEQPCLSDISPCTRTDRLTILVSGAAIDRDIVTQQSEPVQVQTLDQGQLVERVVQAEELAVVPSPRRIEVVFADTHGFRPERFGAVATRADVHVRAVKGSADVRPVERTDQPLRALEQFLATGPQAYGNIIHAKR